MFISLKLSTVMHILFIFVQKHHYFDAFLINSPYFCRVLTVRHIDVCRITVY